MALKESRSPNGGKRPRPQQPEKPQKTKVFISHRHDDTEAARVLGDWLRGLSDRIHVFLASDPQHEGPRIGKPIGPALRQALGETSLVLLLYTTADKDWAWCMWECGVAMDPNDQTPTNVVAVALRDQSPKVFHDVLHVKAHKLSSIEAFVIQLCTDDKIFPNLEGALMQRPKSDPFFKKQAQELFRDLKPFTEPQETEGVRWGGFTTSLHRDIVEKLKKTSHRPTGDDLADVLGNAMVSNAQHSVLDHFGYYAELPPGLTMAELRRRWEVEREGVLPTRINNMPWSEVVGEELWRIVSGRQPNLTWEPFLSVRQGATLWLYPIVYRFRCRDGHYEFNILLVQTATPTQAQ